MSLLEESQLRYNSSVGFDTLVALELELSTRATTEASLFHEYRVLVDKEVEGCYSAQCVELPAAISQGDNLDELAKNMVDAVKLVLDELGRKEDFELHLEMNLA